MRIAARVGRDDRLPRADDVSDDAFARAQHRIAFPGVVLESDRGHAGDHVGHRTPTERHVAIEHEDARRVVLDNRADRLQQVVHHLLQIDRSSG
ncbi:MAG: hypothetical protein A3H96_18955 [Acidobacteria bacterium RIFCSPLOWO2_02_FULL_67_36]|nr:MAG: hypothetical protein A3H96_18955 [Acidobacteria bacterium RIFCSPLOWO2_02_FULL_67_36]OFW20248.1 MAG: hypothetical protein A3G21_26650 [Acidobacteria bacterium RIFCSPLOWO2_12_FULL_66_21]